MYLTFREGPFQCDEESVIRLYRGTFVPGSGETEREEGWDSSSVYLYVTNKKKYYVTITQLSSVRRRKNQNTIPLVLRIGISEFLPHYLKQVYWTG